MKCYLAPMEGITGYIYRRAQHACFPSFDKYFTPFIAPKSNRALSPRERRDILPENNAGMYLVPQLLTCRAEDFIRAGLELQTYGYREINLNLGCPSATVVSKKKGAGMLADPSGLSEFLGKIFDVLRMDISVKTRLGMRDAEEFDGLMEIFGQFPIKELIVHPRVREDYYGNRPDWRAFGSALRRSACPVVYNGDLFSAADVRALREAFPELETVMLGRGAIADPALLRELSGGESLSMGELKEFLFRLARDYGEILSGERDVLFRMKELWVYLERKFPGREGEIKRIRKAQRICEYEEAVRCLLKC